MLILVLSVVFMSFSMLVFATHKNWREAADKLDQQVKEARTQRDQLQSEFQASKNALAAEQASRRFAIAELRSKFEQVRAELQQEKTSFIDLQSANNLLVQTHDTTVKEAQALTDEVKRLRTEISDAKTDRDTQFAEVVRLTDELHRLEGLKSDLEDRREQLLSQNARLAAVMKANGLNEHDNIAMVPPTVDGVVTGVSTNLIEISLGSDDGLRTGHKLEVFRANTYLGRVVIRSTAPDKAVAEIIKSYRRGTIRKGDRVATKLI